MPLADVALTAMGAIQTFNAEIVTGEAFAKIYIDRLCHTPPIDSLHGLRTRTRPHPYTRLR
jgi:hypothetical protein